MIVKTRIETVSIEQAKRELGSYGDSMNMKPGQSQTCVSGPYDGCGFEMDADGTIWRARWYRRMEA